MKMRYIRDNKMDLRSMSDSDDMALSNFRMRNNIPDPKSRQQSSTKNPIVAKCSKCSNK